MSQDAVSAMTYSQRVMLEAERLGMLSYDKQQLLWEARLRGLAGPARPVDSPPLLVAPGDLAASTSGQMSGGIGYPSHGVYGHRELDTKSLAIETGVAVTWTCFLAAAIFFSLAGRLVNTPRGTPVRNALWVGAFSAAAVPFGVLGKIAQRVDLLDYVLAVMVLLPAYFGIGFVVGYVWKKISSLSLS